MTKIMQTVEFPLSKVQQITAEIIELNIHVQRLKHYYDMFCLSIHDPDIELRFVKLIRCVENLMFKLTEQLIKHSHWWNVHNTEYDTIICVTMPDKKLVYFKALYDLNRKIIDVIVDGVIK